MAISLPLVAFLVVGLTASIKIGGGGDLHNLDMFLLGLFFGAVVVWHKGSSIVLIRLDGYPLWFNIAMILLVFIPDIVPLSHLRTYHYKGDLSRFVTLADVSKEKYLNLPPP